MAIYESDPLSRWREAERVYARAAAPFIEPLGDVPPMRKRDLVELVELRGHADRWRERYFGLVHAAGAD